MPTRFYPKKMIAKIRKRKHLNAIHKEKLEKLIKETDNFDNYREEHRRQLTQLNATTLSLDNYHKNKKLKKGGSVPRGRKPKKVVDENKAMVLSQNKAIAHHTDELKTAINKSDKKVEAWVVGKVERASTDISDVTHYLEGQTEYAEGGEVKERYIVFETFPNGRKRKLMDYPDYDTAEVYARMKTNFRSKGNVITIENSQSEVMKEFKKGGKMEMGGQVGDNALVLSANKMGYITEVGNGTYTLRFPEGTQSVFKASELQIMNDDEYFADGGDTNNQWVVYVNNDQNIIGTYDSERLAKRMMKEAWNSGDYESVGVGLKSDAYSDEYYAKGGDTSKYNYGRSWHMDKRKFNKRENYELPINTRKKAMGGDLGKDYEEYEMVVLTKGENGKSHNYRFLVSARNIDEAKQIATDGWNKEFGDMNETFYKVMSDSKYRMDYGMADGGMMEYVGMTDGGRYNIVDEGKVVETNVSQSKVIDYANTTAFYDIMDESDMGDIHEMSNFDDAVKYLGMVGVEVVSIGADGMSVPNKTQYFIENMGGLKDDIDFILEMNDVNYSAKGEDYILVTTPDKIKFIVSDIEDIDDPKAHDIVVRTINNVLHGTYVEPTKKRFTEGMSEKTAEKILKKLGVVGNAPKNETQKARSQANNGLVLFTPEIDKKLFEQYKLGSELENQDVVVKIFNPYGQGTWYIMNADPEEPDYMWGIVDLFETEMGSISRDELVSLRISPLKFKLERDTSFKPTNAKVIFDGLMDGKHFKLGGSVTYNPQKYFDQEIH